jgi:catechol 2,3-dioxygenase-like lactoylglutathione lyase family enzyme
LDFRLEVVQVPVSDVDRAKTFYTEKVGFHADHDTWLSDAVRVVQMTPRGSACSIVIGTGLSDMQPGSVEGLQLTVTDMEAARDELVDRGRRRERRESPGPSWPAGVQARLFSRPGWQRLVGAGDPVSGLGA